MATTAVKGYNTGDDLVRCAVKLHVSEIVRQHLKGDRTALDTATKTTTAATTAVEVAGSCRLTAAAILMYGAFDSRANVKCVFEGKQTDLPHKPPSSQPCHRRMQMTQLRRWAPNHHYQMLCISL